MKKNVKSGFQWNIVLLSTILGVFCVTCILPFIAIASISVSDEVYIAKNGYSLLPGKINLDAYRIIFRNPGELLNSYKITILVVVIGVTASLLLMTMLAYPLSRPDFIFRRKLSFFVFFTMLFNGGMVPTYIVVSNMLHLSDNFFAMVVPYLVSAWNVMLLKTFFQSIPFSLIEAARIDGSGEFRTYFSIVLPVAKPAIATVGVFMTLAYWNDWWLPLLYINDRRLINLQYMLYKIMAMIDDLVNMMQNGMGASIDYKTLPTESARMAMCILAAGPMMFIFPFFQKYFVKGLTVGSVKG